MTNAKLKKRNSYKLYIANRRNLLRLVVRKSNLHIHAQIIDDAKQKTLVFISSDMKKFKDLAVKNNSKGYNIAGAKLLGEIIAKEALKLKIEEVVFDRGRFLYHGRISSVAESARLSGLKF